MASRSLENIERGKIGSGSQRIHLQFLVAVLARREVERNRGQLVNDGDGEVTALTLLQRLREPNQMRRPSEGHAQNVDVLCRHG